MRSEVSATTAIVTFYSNFKGTLSSWLIIIEVLYGRQV